MFVTLALVILEPRFGRLKVANAGHLVPLVREPRGKVEPLESPSNSPLGVREDDTFEQRTYELDRGDVVVLYTDGVTEAQDRRKALYGDERLVKAIAGAPGTAAGVKDAVLASVRAYFDGEAQNDDITVVTVAVR
jgi:sigma-B regulation protein RsbU (phosphoserine phosphatase)